MGIRHIRQEWGGKVKVSDLAFYIGVSKGSNFGFYYHVTAGLVRLADKGDEGSLSPKKRDSIRNVDLDFRITSQGDRDCDYLYAIRFQTEAQGIWELESVSNIFKALRKADVTNYQGSDFADYLGKVAEALGINTFAFGYGDGDTYDQKAFFLYKNDAVGRERVNQLVREAIDSKGKCVG